MLLEDIVQKNVVCTGCILADSQFDLNARFGEIGLRYGFVMDTQLLLSCSAEYQAAWIHAFTTYSTLEESDALEDQINLILRDVVAPEDGFFLAVAEMGTLPPQWVDRALALLLPSVPSTPSVPSVVPLDSPSTPSVIPSVLPNIESKKEVSIRMPRTFASTRRRKLPPPKKLLATTRRKLHV